MKCLKTGFRFVVDGVGYSSDMYESFGRITIVANPGSAHVADTDPAAKDEHHGLVANELELAPGVVTASVEVTDDFRTFHTRWNHEVPLDLLDQPMLIVFRKL